MSDNTEKKVLISVEIDPGKTMKEIANLKQNIKILRDEQSKLDTTTEDGREKYELYASEIRKLTTDMRVQQKQLDNSIKADQAKAGSIDQLKAKLSLLTAEYNSLSKAERKTPDGEALKDEIKNISDELKSLEGGMGNFRRSVGEYEDKIKSALGLNKGFFGSLTNISSGAKDAGTSFGKQAVSGVQSFGKALLSLLANPIVLIIAAIAASVMLLFKAFKSTDEGATALAGIMKGLSNVFDVILDRVASLIEAFKSLIKLDFKGVAQNTKEAFSGVGEAIRDAAKAGWEYEQQMDRIKDLEAGMLVRNAELRRQIEDLKTASKDRTKTDEERQKASAEGMKLEIELRKREKLIEDEKTTAELKNLASKIQNTRLTTKQKEAALRRWLQLDGLEMESLKAKDKAFADFYNKNEDAFQNLQKLRAADIQREADYFRETRRLATEDASLRQSIIDENERKRKEAAERRKNIAERISKAENDLENIRKQTSINNLMEIASSEKKLLTDRIDAQVKADNERIELIKTNRDFELKSATTEAEKRVIRARADQEILAVNKVTQERITEFENQELQKQIRNIAEALTEKKRLFSIDQSNEMQEAAKWYADKLSNMKLTEDEIFSIKKEYEKRKDEISKKYSDLEFNNTIDNLNQQLAMYSENSEEYKAIAKSIADTQTKYNLEATNIIIKSNEEIAKSYEDQIKRQKDAERELSDLRVQLYSQLQDTLIDVFTGIYDYQIQKIDEEKKRVTELYDTQLKAAEGNDKKQKTLEAEKMKRIEEQESRKRKLVREQAIVERAFQALVIGAETAKSVGAISLKTAEITAAAALNPLLIPSIAISASQIPVAAGIGALQLASILSKPLPKASKGMLLDGRSHAQGGIVIEAEGGEAIINKRSTTMFRPLLSAINAAGGGVKFAAGGVPGYSFSDGGFAIRYFNNLKSDKKEMRDAMIEALQELKIYATIEDIRRADKKYSEIEDRASF